MQINLGILFFICSSFALKKVPIMLYIYFWYTDIIPFMIHLSLIFSLYNNDSKNGPVHHRRNACVYPRSFFPECHQHYFYFTALHISTRSALQAAKTLLVNHWNPPYVIWPSTVWSVGWDHLYLEWVYLYLYSIYNGINKIYFYKCEWIKYSRDLLMCSEQSLPRCEKKRASKKISE